MFPLIDALVTKHGFALESWDDRYSKGVWAVLSPSEDLTGDIMAASSDGDLDMIPATGYVLGTDWLPVVTGESFVQALNLLEARLATLPPEMIGRGTDWSNAVLDALSNLREVRRQSGEYGASDGKFTPLPQRTAEMLALAGQPS